ncbi:MAG: hypothetical protein KKF16_05565 [Euryarchaeota archaeon]|nr:hypothetical protein [Euryarchaeota archaeon]MBU4608522.1 hypothetical protein [Euryarchaeota archaeon]MBV1754538.1 hypothetical protein [Methanobacterium sp.]
MTGIDQILEKLRENSDENIAEFIEELIMAELKGLWGWETYYMKKVASYSKTEMIE